MLFSKSFSILSLALATMATIINATPVPSELNASSPETGLQELTKRSSFGWNDWNCKPSPAHPYPLVLVHGLLATGTDNWLYMGPRFALKGYCAFSITYGVLGDFPLVAGLDYMENSAAELATFVDKVLAATGATQVDMVGHSEGTLMPRYYLKFLGGGPKVHKFGGFGAVVYGTTLSGIIPWGIENGLYDPITKVLNPICHSCTQFQIGSPFLTKLNEGGDTVPGPEYLFLISKNDEFITPYTNGILRDNNPKVQNVVLQNYCGLDQAEHALMLLDPIVFNVMHKFLTPSASQTTNCLTLLQ